VSFVSVAPEYMRVAATDLANLGSTISEAHTAAAASTTAIAPAAADEVSAAAASLFSGHAQEFQALSAQAQGFHERFVQAMSAGANTYAEAETNTVQRLSGGATAPAATSDLTNVQLYARLSAINKEWKAAYWRLDIRELRRLEAEEKEIRGVLNERIPPATKPNVPKHG
jgi:hypothetical protein